MKGEEMKDKKASPTKTLKVERKEIKAIAGMLAAKKIPMGRDGVNGRYQITCSLLELAVKRERVNAALIRAALEVQSYDDRLASHILYGVAEDYKGHIKAKRG